MQDRLGPVASLRGDIASLRSRDGSAALSSAMGIAPSWVWGVWVLKMRCNCGSASRSQHRVRMAVRSVGIETADRGCCSVPDILVE